MNLPLPLYMKTVPEEYYDEFIKEREAFSLFMEKYFRDDINNILKSVNDSINEKYPDSTVVWIGGSRSWKKVFECYAPNVRLHKLETASIVPGNYDIFILSNNPQAHRDVVCMITSYFDKYIEAFRNPKIFKLGEHFEVRTSYGNVKREGSCTVKFPSLKGSCTLFPCQSLIISLKSKDITSHPLYAERKERMDRVRKQKDMMHGKKNLGEDMPLSPLSPFASSTTVYFSEDAEYPLIVKPKIMVYAEAFVIPNMDIKAFKSAFLFSKCDSTFMEMNLNYLNPKGLLLMSEYIKNARLSKGLNVDSYRKRLLLNTVVGSSVTVFSAYKEVLTDYINVFGNTMQANSYLVGDFVKALSIHSGFDVEEYIQTNFIDYIRPVTNSFLKYLSNKIDTEFGGDAFLVMVGGDAMRRYDINITNTSDFDTKLYVKDDLIQDRMETRRSKTKSRTKIGDFLITELSQMVVFLIDNKWMMLDDVEKTAIEKSDFKIAYKFDDDGLQFRARYIEKNPGLPVDLYSIDFRASTKVSVMINNEPYYFDVPIDIPFLDIVVTPARDSLFAKEMKGGQLDMSYLKRKTVDENASSVIPVASLDFLLADLEKTYSSQALSASRYWNEKRNKDEHRFRVLSNVRMMQKMPSRSSLDAEADGITWEGFGKDEKRVRDYEQKFRDIIANNRKEHKIRHKMSFYNTGVDTSEEETIDVTEEENYEPIEEDFAEDMEWDYTRAR